ncbi:hypothetical protein [Dactylosporangium sp. NPDC048998]|uniref:hypothetical protein n=1 Tax=Dactylosporangium sp. NPDC048998 TaxID=3363976 RepID=UPI0037153EC5
MTNHVPYVPGPASPAPYAPPNGSKPQPAPGPVVGATVDLAHELAALRKLQSTNLVLAGLTLVMALAGAVFSGFVAYELWQFLGALHRAFG